MVEGNSSDFYSMEAGQVGVMSVMKTLNLSNQVSNTDYVKYLHLQRQFD